MPDRNGQHLLSLFAIFYESNTKGTNFRIMFCIVFNLCEIWTCEISENPWGDYVQLAI